VFISSFPPTLFGYQQLNMDHQNFCTTLLDNYNQWSSRDEEL